MKNEKLKIKNEKSRMKWGGEGRGMKKSESRYFRQSLFFSNFAREKETS